MLAELTVIVVLALGLAAGLWRLWPPDPQWLRDLSRQDEERRGVRRVLNERTQR